MSDTRPFKQLTSGNWQEPDPTSSIFARVSAVAGVVEMDGDAWARQFLAVELRDHVPTAVRNLFEVARGAMVYGWFFYPMFALGESHLYRVVEAAVKERYHQTGGRRGQPTFQQALDWLTECNVIPAEDRGRWDAARRLRNAASHPRQHSAMPPGHVLRMLTASAHDINRLFLREPRQNASGNA